MDKDVVDSSDICDAVFSIMCSNCPHALIDCSYGYVYSYDMMLVCIDSIQDRLNGIYPTKNELICECISNEELEKLLEEEANNDEYVGLIKVDKKTSYTGEMQTDNITVIIYYMSFGSTAYLEIYPPEAGEIIFAEEGEFFTLSERIDDIPKFIEKITFQRQDDYYETDIFDLKNDCKVISCFADKDGYEHGESVELGILTLKTVDMKNENYIKVFQFLEKYLLKINFADKYKKYRNVTLSDTKTKN